jgi:hypothetical protein
MTVPRGPTFSSIECRLATLDGTVRGLGTGTPGTGLRDRLGKAAGLERTRARSAAKAEAEKVAQGRLP